MGVCLMTGHDLKKEHRVWTRDDVEWSFSEKMMMPIIHHIHRTAVQSPPVGAARGPPLQVAKKWNSFKPRQKRAQNRPKELQPISRQATAADMTKLRKTSGWKEAKLPDEVRKRYPPLSAPKRRVDPKTGK